MAHVVTDLRGRTAMFVGDLTRAINYAAHVHGVMVGPMSPEAAKAMVEAAGRQQGDSNG